MEDNLNVSLEAQQVQLRQLEFQVWQAERQVENIFILQMMAGGLLGGLQFLIFPDPDNLALGLQGLGFAIILIGLFIWMTHPKAALTQRPRVSMPSRLEQLDMIISQSGAYQDWLEKTRLIKSLIWVVGMVGTGILFLAFLFHVLV